MINIRIRFSNWQRTEHTRPSSLHLGDVLLLQPELFIYTKDILSHRQGCHAVGVMRDPSEQCGTLSSSEWLPPSLSTTSPSVYCKQTISSVKGNCCGIKNKAIQAAQSIMSAVPSVELGMISTRPRVEAIYTYRRVRRREARAYCTNQQAVLWFQEFGQEWEDQA